MPLKNFSPNPLQLLISIYKCLTSKKESKVDQRILKQTSHIDQDVIKQRIQRFVLSIAIKG